MKNQTSRLSILGLLISMPFLGFSDIETRESSLDNSVVRHPKVAKLSSSNSNNIVSNMTNHDIDIESDRKQRLSNRQATTSNRKGVKQVKKVRPQMSQDASEKDVDEQEVNIKKNLMINDTVSNASANIQNNLRIPSNAEMQLNREMMTEGPRGGIQNNEPRGLGGTY